MSLASRIRVLIDDKEEIKDFLNFSINEKIYSHHEFEVVCRLDTFEKKNSFVMEESSKFIGSVISINIEAKLKGESQVSEHMFKGLITEIRTMKSLTGESDHVIFYGFSPDVLMSDNPGSTSFENKSLKQITDEVLRPYPKDLLKSKIDPVRSDALAYVVQYNESSYEFIRRLAARFGEWFFYDGTQLYFGKLPDYHANLKLGLDLTDFNFSIRMNPLRFKYIAYDRTSAAPVEVSSSKSGGKDNLNKFGKHAHDMSMKGYEHVSTMFYNHLNVPDNKYNKELENVVSLAEDSSALSMSLMHGSSQNPKLRPGCKVNIKALKTGQSGEVDYGTYIITSIMHRCDNTMNYQNNFEAIPAEAKIPDYVNPHLVPHCETQSAIIKENNDPDKMGRVRVNFFWQGKNLLSPWLRIINVYSGAERGFYFIPEVGDEVLIGFEGGNAEKPFVFGGMYHGKNKPISLWSDKDNSFKGIITKSNLKIEFDDKKKITTIETPAGNKAVLSDDGKSIILQDQNQNKVELASGGISLESVKDIKISTKSKVTIEAIGGINISSKSDVKITGLNINMDANAGITAKGNASAELSATGQTTVKGAVVMIN